CGTASGGGQRIADGIGRRDAGAAPQRGDASTRSDTVVPFARQLTAQVANVIGWDGSVYDRDATDFAQAFYARLALEWSVPRAAAYARQRLLAQRGGDPARGRHWH